MQINKGQTWSMDFIMSAIIFIVVLAVLAFSWKYTFSESSNQLQIKKMETSVLDISDALIMTPGWPVDWTPSNVVVLGLSEDNGLLNTTKILALSSMDYEQAREKIGAGIYDFYFRIRDSANQTLELEGNLTEAGLYPTDAKLISKIDRYVVVENTPSVMELMIWT